jgi:hypothetical protein
MDPNRLADAKHSAEAMLVLSVVVLVAAAMLIVSHWLSTRRGTQGAARVETTAPDTEQVFAGASPLPPGRAVAAAPAPASRTAAEMTATEGAATATTASATAPERA